MREIQFDDLETLREEISEEYGGWGIEFEVTQNLIQRFADLTGDHQWIYVDEEKAAKGPFGGTIAHGLLTLSLSSKVRPAATYVAVGQGNTVNYGSDGIRFLAPVLAGSRVHSHSRVTAVEPHKSGTRVSLEVAMHVVGNDRPSLIYKAVMLYAPPR